MKQLVLCIKPDQKVTVLHNDNPSTMHSKFREAIHYIEKRSGKAKEIMVRFLFWGFFSQMMQYLYNRYYSRQTF